MSLILSGTDGLSDVDGTAATPAIRGTDTNTGIFFPAADTVAASVGGTEGLRLTSTGLGVGTSSPAYKFHVQNASANTDTFVGQSSTVGLFTQWRYNATTASAYGEISTYGGSNALYIQGQSGGGNTIINPTSGSVGIGTTSPAYSVDIRNSVSASLRVGSSSNAFGSLLSWDNTAGLGKLWTLGGYDFVFGTNSTERVRITSGGDLLVGKTSTSATTVGVQLEVTGGSAFTRSSSSNSDLNLYVYSTGAGAARFYVGMGGTVYATSTTISAISDQRLKENVQDIDVGLDKIMALKPRKFDWKAGKGKDKKGDRGWIAQELEQVFPEMVETWADPAPEGEEPYKAVNADLIPVLVKAIQEQQAIIESLTARITALEAK